MPSIKAPKDSLTGPAPIPNGVYTIRLDGFKPQNSSKGGSINMNPQLKIVNDPELNDRKVPENLNSQAGWVHIEFAHGFGMEMVENGDDVSIPGTWKCKNHGTDECNCDPKDNWEYIGPLVGKLAKVEIVMTSNNKGGMKPSIKRYFCAIPGCTFKHSESLV